MEGFTLGELVDRHVMEHADAIAKMASEAVQESLLEESLQKVCVYVRGGNNPAQQAACSFVPLCVSCVIGRPLAGGIHAVAEYPLLHVGPSTALWF